ncbi:2-methylfumaryl-CoA isomerase (plasmid) [Azospirillum baldaniorum]|uniref:Dehydratase/racemase n=1 Tax=Azospirillum baldaniorum TaxID=1064539 RepID=A0A9P1NRJ7_9PROT|nr:CoA transferase [Azospirillum baldaniorum]AWJ94707.1 2-methylfumaryl-CoA isomerase [Azospirillum baldaniorum]NUB08898.1 2-methylfumaryl-CoA isomerase [Azospirillum baldaniorum]TWA73203.1 mesaconyl-CoA C1-C4 CoA transferase [Azospirillum brasilense]CCD03118.1 putative dehydratase/racemase [Azospirillum baldaniorum]
MSSLLSDLRVVEVSAFIAAPLGGMTLAQLGAEVIRIDPIGGNIDYRRWPVAPNGTSLYWTALNKAKRSVTLALDRPEGREIAQAIITASGENAGFLLTNLPASGWMGYEALSAKRDDLIMLRLTGNPDGSAAVDYTVNCASGFPMATGRGGEPVNHVLPAWDVAAGLYLATGLLAAERHRRRTGRGQEVTVALADVMLATVGNLGYLADVRVNGAVRPPMGNDLYGAYGRDFATADGRRAMVVAISNRQWKALGKATGLTERLAMIGPLMDVDMNDEGGRFVARDAISAVLAPWFAARTLSEVESAFAGAGVLWGPYRDFGQLVAEDARCSTANPLFREIEQPEVGPLLVPGSPLGFPGLGERTDHRPAPVLGQDTDAVLADLLGLPSAEIGRLHDAGIVA